MGTTTGMVIADGLGVLGGAWICKHIPEITIKWAAGVVFIFFGTLTLYNSVPAWLIQPVYIIPYILMTGLLIYLIGVRLAYRSQQPCEKVEAMDVP